MWTSTATAVDYAAFLWRLLDGVAAPKAASASTGRRARPRGHVWRSEAAIVFDANFEQWSQWGVQSHVQQPHEATPAGGDAADADAAPPRPARRSFSRAAVIARAAGAGHARRPSFTLASQLPDASAARQLGQLYGGPTERADASLGGLHGLSTGLAREPSNLSRMLRRQPSELSKELRRVASKHIGYAVLRFHRRHGAPPGPAVPPPRVAPHNARPWRDKPPPAAAAPAPRSRWRAVAAVATLASRGSSPKGARAGGKSKSKAAPHAKPGAPRKGGAGAAVPRVGRTPPQREDDGEREDGLAEMSAKSWRSEDDPFAELPDLDEGEMRISANLERLR